MKLTEFQKNNFKWIDIVDPNKESIEGSAKEFQLHPNLVQDCLEPEHLPKFERLEQHSFLILRAYDPESSQKVDSVQGITRKIAIFFSEKFMLTIHRKEHEYLEKILAKWKIQSEEKNIQINHNEILADLISSVAKSYVPAVQQAFNSFQEIEYSIFNSNAKNVLKNLYLLKRRVLVMKRMLWLMLEPLQEISAQVSTKEKIPFKNTKESIQKLIFQLDEIQDSLIGLASLQVSLASQKTNEASHKINEIMRVLTILSAFIMPMNFVASIYGMNFEYIPELKLKYGYPMALGVMFFMSAAIYYWFHKKGWLKGI